MWYRKYQFQIKAVTGFYWSPNGWKTKEEGHRFDYFQDAVWIYGLIARPKLCKNCHCEDCNKQRKEPAPVSIEIVPWDEDHER